MQNLWIIVIKSLQKQRKKHTPLGLFGAFFLTVISCQLINLGIQNIWRILDIARYLNNNHFSDLIYQYRYGSSPESYFLSNQDGLLNRDLESLDQSIESLDKKIHRYGSELAQPIIRTINICSNNSVNFSDVIITDSEEYITVICGVVFIFSPVFNLDGFGRAMVSILVLPEEYHWIFASTEDVEDFPGSGLKPVEVELQRQSILEWIYSANGVIAAGAASYEGFLEQEEERADIRSEEVYALLLDVLSEYRMAKSLFKMNLGKYDSNLCDHNFEDASNYQRPIIIMGIFTDGDRNDFISRRQAQKGVNGIIKMPPVEGIDFECYSNFENLKVSIDLKSRENLIQQAF